MDYATSDVLYEVFIDVDYIYKSYSILTDATYGQLNNSIKIPITTSELIANDGINSYQFVYTFDNTKLAYTGYDLTLHGCEQLHLLELEI